MMRGLSLAVLMFYFRSRGHLPLLSSIEHKRSLREPIARRSARKVNLILLEECTLIGGEITT